MTHQMAPAIVKEIKALAGNDVSRIAARCKLLVARLFSSRGRPVLSRCLTGVRLYLYRHIAGMRRLPDAESAVGIDHLRHALLPRVLGTGSRKTHSLQRARPAPLQINGPACFCCFTFRAAQFIARLCVFIFFAAT